MILTNIIMAIITMVITIITTINALTSTSHFSCRTKQHEVHADYWRVIRPAFDVAMKATFEEASADGIQLARFVQSHTHLLALFMDANDLAEVEKAPDLGDVAEQVKRLIESSSTGKAMYGFAWLTCSKRLLEKDCSSKLQDVIHLDFEDVAVGNYEQVMTRAAAKLVEIGHPSWKRRSSKMSFLGEEVAVEIETLNDEWQLRFAAAVLSIGINAGHLRPLPWEKVLVPPGTVAGVPLHCRIPSKIFEEFLPAREAMHDACGDEHVDTITEMIKIARKKAPGIKKHCGRSIILTMAFLTDRAETMLCELIHRKVLETFPSEGRELTMTQAEGKL